MTTLFSSSLLSSSLDSSCRRGFWHLSTVPPFSLLSSCCLECNIILNFLYLPRHEVGVAGNVLMMGGNGICVLVSVICLQSLCLTVRLKILNSFNILIHFMLCFKCGSWVVYGRVHVLHCETQQTSPLAPLSRTANLALCPTGRHSIPQPVPNCQIQQNSLCGS